MRSLTFLLLLVLPVVAAPATEPSPRQRIAAAEKRIKRALAERKRAASSGEQASSDALLEAMRGLGRIPCRAALKKLAKYLGNRDIDVSRAALEGLREPTVAPYRLVAGHLIATRLPTRGFDPRRRELYLEMVRAVRRSGYLGAFERLETLMRKSRDNDLVLLVAETFAEMEDARAIPLLSESTTYGRHEKSYHVTPSPRSTSPNNTGSADKVRENAGSVTGPSVDEQQVRNSIIQSLYSLIGREDQGFASYGEYSDFMSKFRGTFLDRAKKIEDRAKEQKKSIKSCP